MAPLKGRGKTQTSPSAASSSANTQQETVSRAAAQFHISPETIWGVYGTESDFGNDPSTSTAGAEGPFQFLPSTGREYGLNSQTIHQFVPSCFACAHYLHNLGADSSPTSDKTFAALNGYNGNGGGTSRTEYVKDVLTHGGKYGGKNSKTSPAENSGESGNSGGGFSATTSLWDLVTGNLDALGSQFALLALGVFKDIGVGFWDYVIGPAWHWNQRTVAWYGKFTLDPRQVGNGSETQWAMIWTAAFWSMGYAILWTGEGEGLAPVPVHRSRLAAHVRRAQALPAKRDLIKPRDVKKNTPRKPAPVQSRAKLTHVNTLNTTRNRTVKVTANGSGVESQIPIEQVGETPPERRERRRRETRESNPLNNSRAGAPKGGRGNP